MSDSTQFPPPDPTSFPSAPPATVTTYAPLPREPRTPWSAGRKAVLITGIVAAGLGLITGIVVGTITLVNAVVDAAGEIGPVIDGLQPPPEILPLIDGVPGSPVAVNPETCPEACFTDDDVAGTIVGEFDYSSLGLTKESGVFGDVANTGVQAEFGYSAGSWVDREGSPEECFVTYIEAPIAVALTDRPGLGTDSILWTGRHEDADAYNAVTTVVRVAPDSETATAHLSSLDTLLSGCDRYEIGKGADYWSAKVSRAPQLSLPETVAAVGWVEDAPYARFYAIDLQRSNLILRITGFTDGTLSEADFRAYVEQAAVQLSEIELG